MLYSAQYGYQGVSYMAKPEDDEIPFQGAPDPFDPDSFDPDPEAGAWFLPPPFDPDEDGLSAPPGAPAGGAGFFDPADWQAAQGRHAPALAALAFGFGRLEERLAALGPGARLRLALEEVSQLAWWSGERVGADPLALHLADRAGSPPADHPALARAAWAVRRLTRGAPPGQQAATIAAFLGRRGAEGAVPDLALDLAEAIRPLAGLHPVVQAAALFQARLLARADIGAGDTVPGLEAAVLAARAACAPAAGPDRIGQDGAGQSGAGQSGAGQGAFLPLALAGTGGLRAGGPPAQRLGAWIAGAGQAVTAALLRTAQLRDWEARAGAALAGLSGRTPPRLVLLLAAWPMVTAPMAAARTGASRAAVQRNLDIMERHGLIREVTGQGRYRVWTARL